MANRYLTLPGTDIIKDSFDRIPAAFDKVQADMDGRLSNALRQAVINGGFPVNQRVKSGTVILAAGAYGHDRWKAGSAGCTYTFATVNNVITITILSGSLMQVVEGINIYSGNYKLSWTGTSQGRINSGTYGSSGVSALLTGGNNTTIEFSTGTLSNVQFNYGSDLLPFQPRNITEEISLAQRYYRVFGAGVPGMGTGTTSFVLFLYGLKMRISVPQLVQLASTFNVYDGSSNISSSATLTTGTADVGGMVIGAAGASGITATRPLVLNTSNVFALDAEL